MAPSEFHRYTDARGDIIIYKFDPDVARNPDKTWPNDSAVSVYHHYILNKHCTINYHSDLLPLGLAMERWRNDKQSSQPIVGMVMYKENAPVRDGFGAQLKTQYMWKGWNHGEGYRRGWAKLQVHGLDESERVTVVRHDKGKGRAELVLEPLPRAKAAVAIGEKERKDSKDLQDLEDLHAMQVEESLKALEHAKSSQHNMFDVLAELSDESPPEIEMEHELSDSGNEHDPVVEEQEPDQDAQAPTPKKKKPNKHRNRKKGKQVEVEYSVDDLVPIIAPEDIPSAMRQVMDRILNAVHQQDPIIDTHEKEQERVMSKKEKRKQGKRGEKVKKLDIDYRLAHEDWPGLLHTPR